VRGYFSILEQFTGEELEDNYGVHDVSVNVKVSRDIIISELETCLGMTGDGHNFISYTNMSILKTFLHFLYQKLELLMTIHPEEAIDTGKKMICILEGTDSDDDCFPEYEIETIRRITENTKSEINMETSEENESRDGIAYEKIKKDIKEIISAFSEINDMAYCQYKPIAEDICSRIISENQLNHIMDRMMDFCADNRMLELFKKVCRKYLDIYPETIVFQINQYKEMYEEDE